jgi:O-antigen ligase
MGALSIGALVVFLTGKRIWQQGRWLWATAFLAVAVVLGLFLGGETLSKRFIETAKDPLNGRGEIYETARRMSAESGWFGNGAGSFTALNALYRADPTQAVHGYVHNDWWETQITLGWIGLGAIVVMMLLVPVIAFGSLGRPPSREFAGLVALALLGMLGHAVGDVPFQVRSLLFQFLVTMAMASAMVRRTRR